MTRRRRTHTAVFKKQVAVAAIKEELTQAQITSQYEVHMTQVKQWRQQALEAIEGGFSKRLEREQKDQSGLIASLYEQIGRLQMQLDWIKKKSGLE